jgi:hypothetical protein
MAPHETQEGQAMRLSTKLRALRFVVGLFRDTFSLLTLLGRGALVLGVIYWLFSWPFFGWHLRWWWVALAVVGSTMLDGASNGFRESYSKISALEVRARAIETNTKDG